ncbi:hypothetical protein HPB47_010841 [Ixodes persulcatus]|uniref:Uncharacterized protein n=1 Tax=Ixodes persulcatus TaxID=34615 RepID=A0AC60NXZ2_IXOPE|nr:hypothetical protein HPB47_010841 [Ixodes persulcatus]
MNGLACPWKLLPNNRQRLRPPPVPAEPWPEPSEPWPPEAPASPHADSSGFCIPPDRSVLIKNCLKLTIRQRREALGLGDIAPDFKTAGPEEVVIIRHCEFKNESPGSITVAAEPSLRP